MATWLARRTELRGAEHAARADLGELHARVGGPGARFVPHHMAFAADDHIVTRTRQHAQRHLVGHRSGRQKKRSFLAQQRRHALLQRLTVGSSPYWSSPTGAAAIAERIAAVGRVTVSERRSIVSVSRRRHAPTLAQPSLG